MKICLFGGTFDPPHLGHLLIAQTICETEEFDKIIFVPAFIPPHKHRSDITPVTLRKKMLEIAIEGNPNFEISDVEIKRGGVSYSIDTIREIKKQYNLKGKDVYFLIGSDTLMDFDDWKKPDEILRVSRVIVAIRPGFRPSSIPQDILEEIRFANIPRFEISSTTIRQRWQANKTIRYMVSQPVWEFINDHRLYTL